MAFVRAELKQRRLYDLKSLPTCCSVIMAVAKKCSSTAGGAVKGCCMTNGRPQLFKLIYVGECSLGNALFKQPVRDPDALD